MSLAGLFPDQDYQFQLRFEQGEPARYFQPTAHHEALIAERVHWLRTEPEKYSALLPEAAPLLNEVTDLAREWQSLHASPENHGAREQLLALGECWEPDYLLLRADSDQKVRLYGGCVCFPSSWRLSDKIGQPIEFIHAPVPGLNENISSPIHKFLTRLKPGVAWQRTNWGLSASPELNQHPDRQIPPLAQSVRLNEVWLRVEHQALIALPRTSGILFGIRVTVHPLADVRSDPVAASRLLRALKTMPPDLARYKGISVARDTLITLLLD